MPVDHSNNGFFKDLGNDWLAIAANGAPLARAATEDGVRRAVPDAAEYITGKKPPAKAEKIEAAPTPAVEPVAVEPAPADIEPVAAVEPEQPEPVTAVEPEPETPAPAQDPLDHDGNGRRGGSRRQRRPAA